MDKKYIELLKSYQTDDHKHGSRHLLDHLVGTYNILNDWNIDEDICVAGLFHSIYGTEFHLQAATGLSQRDVIKEAIGERSEFLAYVFCVSKRFEIYEDFNKSTFSIQSRDDDELITLTDKDALDLFVLELANLIEQVDYFEYISPATANMFMDALKRCEDLLPDSALTGFMAFVDKHHPNPLIRPSMYGDLKQLKVKLSEGHPVNNSDSDGRSATALLYATVYNQVDIVKLLIEKGADPNIPDKYGNLPLGIAKKNKNNEIISILTEYDE